MKSAIMIPISGAHDIESMSKVASNVTITKPEPFSLRGTQGALWAAPFGATFPACQSRVFWPTLARGMPSALEKPGLAADGRRVFDRAWGALAIGFFALDFHDARRSWRRSRWQ